MKPEYINYKKTMADFNNTQNPGQFGYGSVQGSANYSYNNGQFGVDKPPRPDNYMAMSIVATVLGFCSCIPLILGIIAIIFASQVNSKYDIGNYAGAENDAKTSKVLAIISLVLALLGFVGNIIYMFVVYGAAILSIL